MSRVTHLFSQGCDFPESCPRTFSTVMVIVLGDWCDAPWTTALESGWLSLPCEKSLCHFRNDCHSQPKRRRALLCCQPPGLKSGDSQTRACGLVCEAMVSDQHSATTPIMTSSIHAQTNHDPIMFIRLVVRSRSFFCHSPTWKNRSWVLKWKR